MVCMGNICRSPLAEELLRQKAKQKNLSVEIDSAGIESYHVGEAPDWRTMQNAKQHGIDLNHLRARQFHPNDFDKFDKIFVMDSYIYNEVISHVRTDSDKQKVEMILNLLFPNENKPVPDPYYGGEKDFEEVFQLLNNACEKIARLISENKL